MNIKSKTFTVIATSMCVAAGSVFAAAPANANTYNVYCTTYTYNPHTPVTLHLTVDRDYWKGKYSYILSNPRGYANGWQVKTWVNGGKRDLTVGGSQAKMTAVLTKGKRVEGASCTVSFVRPQDV